jgi:hypothetical protein
VSLCWAQQAIADSNAKAQTRPVLNMILFFISLAARIIPNL